MLLHDVLDAAAAAESATGHRPALIVDGVTYSFQQVKADADALARGVATISAAGDTIALLAPNCYGYPLAYYGVPRAGRVLLPLNQRLHPREWATQLERARATVLLADCALLEQFRAQLPIPESVRTVAVLNGAPDAAAAGLTFEQLLEVGSASSAALPEVGANDPAWLMFTSGTTGRPKGVLLPHRSLLAGVRHSVVLRPMTERDVFLTAFPMCHVAGYQVIAAHLRRRPTVVLRRFDAEDFVAAVRDHGVTTCSLAPTMLDLLLDHLRTDPAALALVRGRLRAIGYGSAPMPPALIRRVTDALDCELNQGYGMTELAGNVTALGAAEHRAAITGEPALLASAGTPGPLVNLAIMAPGGTVQPPGVSGEIVVRGEQVCAGYYDDPEATESAMAGGWFHTGDLGVIGPDGRLSVVDRLKDIIVTGGENVASREVEDTLRELAGVRDVAVVGVSDARWGERICAVVVADPAAPPAASDLVAGCRARLAGFKTPRSVTFVDELPRTASGKVRKDELRQRLS